MTSAIRKRGKSFIVYNKESGYVYDAEFDYAGYAASFAAGVDEKVDLKSVSRYSHEIIRSEYEVFMRSRGVNIKERF
jgi:hypothetical protein